MPPWGGETAIDLLPLLDWDALRAAEPTWLVGYSDLSTILTPLTLLTGIATVHGNNLMDTPYEPPPGLLSWLDIVAMEPGTTFTQISPNRYRAQGHDDWVTHPEVSELTLDTPGRWTRLDGGGDVEAEGRLIGGCMEMLCNLTGSRYGDPTAFARAPERLLVYVEACEHDAATICRNLHGMRLAGFFDAANAILVGRTRAPGLPSLTQHEAVLDALGGLGVPHPRRRRVRPRAAVPADRQRRVRPGAAHRRPGRTHPDPELVGTSARSLSGKGGPKGARAPLSAPRPARRRAGAGRRGRGRGCPGCGLRPPPARACAGRSPPSAR